MRILIFGATGLLGHHLMEILPESNPANEVFGTSRQNYFDSNLLGEIFLDRENDIRKAIAWARPDIIINAAGIVKQKIYQFRVDEVIRINSVYPQWMAAYASDIGIPVILISSDCVYSGKDEMPFGYTEFHCPDPIDLYGYTKLLGEVDMPGVVTLRTSFIGEELGEDVFGLLDWARSKIGGAIEGYTNAWFSGLMASEIVRAIEHVIYPLMDGKVKGLYHLAGERITKFDLLNKLNIAYDLHMEISSKVLSENIDRTLDGTKFEKDFHYKPNSWDTMLNL